MAKMIESIATAYQGAKHRLLLLDYDGTLVRFAPTPEEAVPTKHVLRILQKLAADARNTIAISSGRERASLEHMVGQLDVSLAAEHGCFLKEAGAQWQAAEAGQPGWKIPIRELLQQQVDAWPGSFIEEKASGLAWHYRRLSTADGRAASRSVIRFVTRPVKAAGLRLIAGHKVIEVLSTAQSKGTAAQHWLAAGPWDFILAVGDDRTDEDMFAVLPPEAFSIKIGRGKTLANHHLPNPAALLSLLHRLQKSGL